MIFEEQNSMGFINDCYDYIDDSGDGSGHANGHGNIQYDKIDTGNGYGYGDGQGYEFGDLNKNGTGEGCGEENMIVSYTEEGLQIYLACGDAGGHGNIEGIGYSFNEFE